MIGCMRDFSLKKAKQVIKHKKGKSIGESIESRSERKYWNLRFRSLTIILIMCDSDVFCCCCCCVVLF